MHDHGMTRILPLIARVLLGLVFFVFGLNGFFHFMPRSRRWGPADAFLGALFATGYMFPLIKGVEVVAGALLLAGPLRPARARAARPDRRQHRRLPHLPDPRRGRHVDRRDSSLLWPSSAGPTAAASAASSTPTPPRRVTSAAIARTTPRSPSARAQ
jgi:hypothetical protein